MEETRKLEDTRAYLGVYKNTNPENCPHSRWNFSFSLGRKDDLAATNPVCTIPVPKRYAKELQNELDNSQTINLGYIDYAHYKRNDRSVAVSLQYHPKDLMEEKAIIKRDKNLRKIAPGLASFLEALCVANLKKSEGITHVRTTTSPSISRTRQVIRAGLPRGIEVNVSEWLKGLGFDASGMSRPLSTWLMPYKELVLLARFSIGGKKWVRPVSSQRPKKYGTYSMAKK